MVTKALQAGFLKMVQMKMLVSVNIYIKVNSKIGYEL